MLDIALIREKPDWLKEQILKLNDPEAAARIDNIITVDKDRRSLLTEAEAIQAQRNRLNKAVGPLRGNKKLDDAKRYAIAQAATAAIKAGDYAQAEAFITFQAEPATDSAEASALDALTDALREMGDNYNALQEKIRVIEDELNTLMLWVPNIPHESVPVAMSEDDNIAWEPEGEFYTFDFEPKPHWELGPELGIIDFERGVKIAGTRSYILKGLGARLQRALAAFFLDMALEKGYEEVYVPFMLHEEMMYGSGQFPKFRDVVYMDQDAGIYMLPTAEVAIANMHRDEILNEDQLPLYYVGHTPCFRREKTSAGRDTRGIKRVHQFQKVEMFKFTTPETSYEELESLTEAACDLARALKIPFRRLEIVTGDLGFTATKKYDVELWAPGSQEWLEVSSCSNTEDFQARRANIRYRKEGEKRLQFVHTLNGSGLALPRTVIAILENYQQADGSVKVPEVLIPYLGGQDVIR
jgi:seryl-tRNA synthetase